MGNTLIRVYDKLSSAEQARNALLASGFSSESVHLTSNEDDAGPVEGNFVLEYKDARHANDKSTWDSLLDRDDINEGLGRQGVAWRGNYLLTVEAQDDEQFHRASDITRKFDAHDSGERSP